MALELLGILYRGSNRDGFLINFQGYFLRLLQVTCEYWGQIVPTLMLAGLSGFLIVTTTTYQCHDTSRKETRRLNSQVCHVLQARPVSGAY